jgi:hypothetical protein
MMSINRKTSMNTQEFEADFDLESMKQLCNAVPGAVIKKPLGDAPHVILNKPDSNYRNVVKTKRDLFDLWLGDHTMILHDATFEQAVMFLNNEIILKILKQPENDHENLPL